MKIGLLTSSRADYSIYYPLICKLFSKRNYELEIIAFGTHLSAEYGHTVDQIEADGFVVRHKLTIVPKGNSPFDIAKNMGEVTVTFADFWEKNKFDMVFCLGDRYEMFSAVAAGVPFNVKFAHLYGGEKTTGAIDDCLRHAVSHMSKIHFTSCQPYADRVQRLIETDENVYNVGALSYDNFKQLNLFSIAEFEEKYNIDLNKPTILVTVHPETVLYDKNFEFAKELEVVFSNIQKYQILITMPNADTNSSFLRSTFQNLANTIESIYAFESLGTIGYLSAMKHCTFMMGNTSSGFVEAAWFPKKVINIGNRQNGRIVTPNIINCDYSVDAIQEAILKCESLSLNDFENIYGDGKTADRILEILAEIKI